MILTIGQYIEALTNSDGRFRTLGKVYPVEDASGDPVFTMPGHGLVDFEVISVDARLTLRCPLKSDAAAAAALRGLREKDRGMDSRFFKKWDLLEKEIILFDASGNPVEADILVRTAPQGDKAADFLQKAASENNTAKILTALASFGELAGWAYNAGRGVVARKLLVSPDGEVSVTGFSANDESAMTALAFLFTAAMPARFADTELPLMSGSSSARPLVERLCAAASGLKFAEPAEILAGDVAAGIRKLSARAPEEISALGDGLLQIFGTPDQNQTEVSGEYSWREEDGEGLKCVRDGSGWRYVDRGNNPVIETVWLSASPFREGRAEVETTSGKGLIDKEGYAILDPVYEEVAWDEYWGLVAAMTEGCWSLLDRDGIVLTKNTYDWLGECSEGLILAQKDGKCGFIDAEGCEIIPFVYDDATSFSEGCAFVTVDGESFYIDGKGGKPEVV